MIWHPAEKGADFGWVVDHIDAADFHRSHGRVIECSEHPHGGGFTRTIGTDESAYGTVRNLEAEPIYRFEFTEIAVEVFD